jgi:hypothetical protein
MHYEVNIDFDEASKAWNKNKKKTGNSNYEYICTIINKHKNKCCRKIYNNSKYCYFHRNIKKNDFN